VLKNVHFACRPLGFDIQKKTIYFVGEGNTPISFTSRPDVAHFVAYTVSKLPLNRLANATLVVKADQKTVMELVELFGDVFGGTFTPVSRSVEEAEKNAASGAQAAIVDILHLCAAKGLLDVGSSDNDLVPDFKPLNVHDSLKKYYS
jgi:hypothetical protein